MDDKMFCLHDSSLSVVVAEEADSRPLLIALCRYLKSACRFTVTKDHRIERDYKSLSKTHRYGNHGYLECEIEYYPRGVKIEFFQNVVYENPHGGRYDFGKREKMPYLIGLRFTWAIRKLVAWLSTRGYVDCTRSNNSPNPDPLAWFNRGWDGEYERKRGIHRFSRREDGWPDESELNHWSRTDGSGCVLNHGQTKFILVKGRAMRCVVYGGINGMWACVYGPGPRDWSPEAAKSIFDKFPGRGRIFSDATRKKKAESRLEAAVKERKFLLAHSISSYLANA